jgi:hypothetical protein
VRPPEVSSFGKTWGETEERRIRGQHKIGYGNCQCVITWHCILLCKRRSQTNNINDLRHAGGSQSSKFSQNRIDNLRVVCFNFLVRTVRM